jgi:two-component system, chemotaxis family, protein-glutamate methylesterase/glutaminase
MSEQIRVLVVDDSAFARLAVTRMLRADPEIVVVGVAIDGKDAVEKVLELKPDVVTLDIQMPNISGLDALRQIMARHPLPVLLLSSLTQEGADVTLRGLELGAMDFVDKSSVRGSMNLLDLGEELRAKVRALAQVPVSRLDRAHAERRRVETQPAVAARADLIVLAASTGGPAALQAVIPRLPAALPAGVLVVQHIPPGFTRSLAERLAARSAVPVREAEEGDAIVPGQVLIAPAGSHLTLKRVRRGVYVCLSPEPSDSLHRPSADVVMASAAQVYGPRVLGVVMTGMGSDGTVGLTAIRASRGRTLAESEETCVIYGMPKAASDAGVVDRLVPLYALADEIVAAV